MSRRDFINSLTTQQTTLIYNALLDKANLDRMAADGIHPDVLSNPATLAIRQTLYAEADMAEALAEEFI